MPLLAGPFYHSDHEQISADRQGVAEQPEEGGWTLDQSQHTQPSGLSLNALRTLFGGGGSDGGCDQQWLNEPNAFLERLLGAWQNDSEKV